MHSHVLLHKLLVKALPSVHKKRIGAVTNAVEALMVGKKLTLTLLGRNMQGAGKERHHVRKMDRLLGNPLLHEDLPLIYEAKARLLLSSMPSALILVDWSATDKRKDFHILRASMSIQGRSEVIYQEVHEDCCLNNHKIHKAFLRNVKTVLPDRLAVTIVTDAAFCNPWFKEVTRLGWDFIGRTKSTVNYSSGDKSHWQQCETLYSQATDKANWVKNCVLTKTNPIPCHIVHYKSEIKGRVRKTRGGKKAQNTESKRMAIRQRTPWVLVTSLPPEKVSARQVVQLYKKRMQIEEDFRDTKSTRYGFSLRESMSKNPKRLEVLLLIAMLATFTCWLLALEARAKKLHYDYQANTIRERTVLSSVYLGCQLARRRFSLSWEAAQNALIRLQQLIAEAALCKI